MHLQTRKNLHSHHFNSPLSNNYEVSAFGEDGVGDEGNSDTFSLSPNMAIYIMLHFHFSFICSYLCIRYILSRR